MRSFFIFLMCSFAFGELKHGQTTGKPRIDRSGESKEFRYRKDTVVNGDIKKRAHCLKSHPIESYMQMTSSSSPQAAKDGGLYFQSDLRETPQVFYLKKPLSWPVQMTFFKSGVQQFLLSPDGEKILMSTDVNGDENWNLYLQTIGTKDLTPLLVDQKERIENFRWSKSSQWFSYTSNKRNQTDMDLYTYQLGKGSELVLELKGAHFVSDISPNERFILLTQYRSINDSDVILFDRVTKKTENLTAHLRDISNGRALFSADSENVIYLSDESGINQVIRMPINNPTGKTLLLKTDHEVEAIEMDQDKNYLIATLNIDAYASLMGVRVNRSGRKVSSLEGPTGKNLIFGEPRFHPFDKEIRLFYSKQSSKDPSTIWEWAKNSERQWTKNTHGLISPECLVEEKNINYTSFDGKKIPAFLYEPQNRKGTIPFLMYVHGGPESQFRPYLNRTFQYFLDHGFGIFAPNVRGSSGYGRDYLLLDNYKRRMDSVEDAIRGARWLIENGYTSPQKLGIFGGSYGGFMVLRTIQMAPSLFAAACESVGISNFVTFLKNTKSYRRALREVEYGPLSDTEFLKSISPIHYLDQIKTPLLIFHGANDPRVPLSESTEITEALKKRKISVELKVFPDEGHGNKKLSNIMEQAKIMVGFFERILK